MTVVPPRCRDAAAAVAAPCWAVAMVWRPAAPLLLLLLVVAGRGAGGQQGAEPGGAGGSGSPQDEEYLTTSLLQDYPEYDHFDDHVGYGSHYGPFTPVLANTTLYKCLCGGGEAWDDGRCRAAAAAGGLDVPVRDYWTRHTVHANASQFGDVQVGEVTCSPGYSRVVLHAAPHDDHDGVFLLEYSGVLWRDAAFANYCVEHVLLSAAEAEAGQPQQDQVVGMEAHLCLPPPPVPLCCPRGHAMLPNGTCYPAKAAASAAPPLRLVVAGQHVAWRILEEDEGVVTNLSCPPEDTFYRRLAEANVTLVYDPRGAVLQWLPPAPASPPRHPQQYCLALELPQGQHQDDASPAAAPQYTTLFCHTDPEVAHRRACTNVTCVRKCCPDHFLMAGSECVPAHDASEEWTPTFYEADTLQAGAAPPADLALVHGLPLCPPYKLRPDQTADDRFFLLAESGELFTPAFGVSYPPTQYCMDLFVADDHPLQELALLCFPDETVCGAVRSMAYPALLAVSCVFLAFTLLVYVSVPELHAKVHGKCLVSHVTALLLAYLCLIVVQWSSGHLPDAACKIMASLTHVSFLAAFFWLNVMCFDIWWTLKSMRPVAETGELSRLRFKMYSIYSWGCPVLISLVAIIIDALPDHLDVTRPGFGDNKCWFADNKPLWAYFYGFVLALVVANIILFCQVAYILIMAQNDPILQRTRQQNRERMWLYIKLFVVMGLTWIMEVISWQEGSCEPWIIPDVINALQGFSIFLIFICKRNMLKRIRNNWEPYLRRMKVFVGSSRQPDSTKGKAGQDTSSFTSSVNRPTISSQSGASQRTVQSQLSLDTSSSAAFRKLSSSSLVSTTGVQIHTTSSLCMDTITEADDTPPHHDDDTTTTPTTSSHDSASPHSDSTTTTTITTTSSTHDNVTPQDHSDSAGDTTTTTTSNSHDNSPHSDSKDDTTTITTISNSHDNSPHSDSKDDTTTITTTTNSHDNSPHSNSKDDTTTTTTTSINHDNSPHSDSTGDTTTTTTTSINHDSSPHSNSKDDTTTITTTITTSINHDSSPHSNSTTTNNHDHDSETQEAPPRPPRPDSEEAEATDGEAEDVAIAWSKDGVTVVEVTGGPPPHHHNPAYTTTEEEEEPIRVHL